MRRYKNLENFLLYTLVYIGSNPKLHLDALYTILKTVIPSLTIEKLQKEILRLKKTKSIFKIKIPKLEYDILIPNRMPILATITGTEIKALDEAIEKTVLKSLC